MLGTYALSSGYYEAYYGQRQQVRTQDRRGLPRPPSPTSTSSSRRPRRRSPSSSASKTDDPLAMYLNDYFTVPMPLGGHPGDLDPRRPRRARGRRPELPVGFQIAGPGVQRERAARRRLRARAGDRLRRDARRLADGLTAGGGDRAGDPRPARDPDEDVLRLRALLRRRAQRPHLPGLPRPPRDAAGAQRAGDPLRAEDRRGARVRGRAALDLPPQELLLSRQPEGLPDQPVRHPACPRRPARRRPHPPRPPRGGRGEDDPRRRVGPDPRLRRLAGRLQPRRHAAGRDRHRARPAQRRRGARVGAAAAHDGRASSASPT